MQNLLGNLPCATHIVIMKYLPFNQKLSFIETIARFSEDDIYLRKENFFDIYISKKCFDDGEIKKLLNSFDYYALNGYFKLLKLSFLFGSHYNLISVPCKCGHFEISKICLWICSNCERLVVCTRQYCPWNGNLGSMYPTSIILNAVKGGHFEILKMCREQDPPIPWDKETCAIAALKGRLDILKWCRKHGCPWTKKTCANAAEVGSLDILQWCRQQDPPCPWNKKTCSRAAEKGRLDILKWCRQQVPPCPWNKWSCAAFAASNKDLEMLDWCEKQNP